MFTVDPKKYIVGSANPYYRATGVSSAWTPIGITTDDTVVHVALGWFRPDNLSGVRGIVKGLDFLRRIEASGEFNVPELSAANMGAVIPGAIASTPISSDTGAGIATTLAAAAAPGDTNVKATAVAGITAGMWFRIDTGSVKEIRQIDVVGTAGAGGTGLSFRDPLQRAHASLLNLVQADGDGRTTISAPTVRRQPDTAYNDWALVAESGNGYAELRLLNAISVTDTVDITMGDQTLAAVHANIAARLDGANLATSPFQLILPN